MQQFILLKKKVLFILQYFAIACNIDHNSSSNTSQDSFHGTAISRTQHVTNENSGTETSQNKSLARFSCQKTIKPIPHSFITVPPAASRDNSPPTSESRGTTIPNSNIIPTDDAQQDIEMPFLAAIGDWLEDSGRISLISKTDITTQG